jgi:hypothetical protein
MKPEFIDNRDGNTLAEALRGHIAWANENFKEPLSLSIATAYFNAEGFSLLAEPMAGLKSIRLLLGAEPSYPPAKRVHLPGEPRGERLRKERLADALAGTEKGIRGDRDLMDFAPGTSRAVRRLLEFLARGTLEVRRYEKGFLHGKAFVFSNQDGAIAGSSNFTQAGLTGNLELNLGHYAPGTVGQVQSWFDDLWAEAAPYDLATLYAERFEEFDPYLVYLRILWERYGSELDEERDATSRIRLTTFQNDGVFRAERILDQYHGVVIADGVGLGKTFIAGEIIRRVREMKRQHVVIVAPAALREGTWRAFRHEHDLMNVECVSYEQLFGDPRLGGEGAPALLCKELNDYGLIVLDEAHALRNPDTARAEALRTLLRGDPPKDLMLLTATPVNNSLWDLYYLLTYFVGHDAVFADRGIPSLKDRFQQVSQIDPESLKPEALFDVLDAVAVRRTRHFVKRYYPNDRVRAPGGAEIPVRFPEPEVKAVSYRFDAVLPGFFAEFERAIMPEDGDPLLTMARFNPSRFRKRRDPDAERSEVALAGLIRSALLKRFESSVYAFATTADRMVVAHDMFLQALDRGWVPTAEALAAAGEVEDTGNDELLDEVLRDAGSEPTDRFHVARLRAAVMADRELLAQFGARASAVKNEDDPKLAALTRCLSELAKQADRDGANPEDARDCRKVLVFSYYADTVDWIVKHLRRVTETDKGLAVYRGRLASVSGKSGRDGVSRADAVFGFVPRSSEAPPVKDADRYDILVCTDVLAEGLNLQQARNIVNFDLPWNPMRLVQRHGRIDRIGSPHERVFIRCFFPDERLDELLALEERIRRKLAQAAKSIGVENEVIPGGAVEEVVFSEPREEIERLRREDASLLVTGGEDQAAHSGEEYRQELRKGIERYGEERIRGLPWGAGSGFAGGAERGHVFCARIGDRPFLRFVPVNGGKATTDTLSCLRLVACRDDTPRSLPNDMEEAAYAAWRAARRSIFEEWSFSTDPKNLQPKVRPLFLRAAEHLRKHPPDGVAQTDLTRAIAALEAPRTLRIERAIRAVLDVEGKDPRVISADLVAKVRHLGLQPFVPPKPLAPIEEEDVVLICWMAVTPIGRA